MNRASASHKQTGQAGRSALFVSWYGVDWTTRMRDEKTVTQHDDAEGSHTGGKAEDGMSTVRGRTTWWRRLERWHKLLPVLLVVVALGLYLPRLSSPEKYVFDELIFAYTAGEYVEGNADAYRWDHPCSVTQSDAGCVAVNPDAEDNVGRIGKYQWAHPPLGKYFIAVGILLFGDDSFGWRIPSVIAGAIGIFLAFRLGFVLTGRRAVGLLTAGLLLLDGLYFVYSRMGLIDIYLAVIMLGAMLAFTSYLNAPPGRVAWPLFTTGLLLGMGIATKWSAAYGALFVGLFALWRLARLFRQSRAEGADSDARQGFRAHLIWVPLALGVVPAAVYLLAYTPFVLAGNYDLATLIELQRAIIDLQTTLETSYRTASRWWEWPLVLQSVWFGDTLYRDGRIATIYVHGTPFLYWAILPAMAWLCVRWLRARNPALIVLAIGFFGQWLPWIFVEREAFIYHFLPAVPFGCLAVATALVHFIEGDSEWKRTLAIQFVVLVALTFVFFYPTWSFYPVSEGALALRLWFEDWRR